MTRSACLFHCWMHAARMVLSVLEKLCWLNWVVCNCLVVTVIIFMCISIIQLFRSVVMKTREIWLSPKEITSVNLCPYASKLISEIWWFNFSNSDFVLLSSLWNRFGSRIVGRKCVNSRRISNHRMQIIQNHRVGHRARRQHCRHHVAAVQAATQSPITIVKHPVRVWQHPRRIQAHRRRWSKRTAQTIHHRTTIKYHIKILIQITTLPHQMQTMGSLLDIIRRQFCQWHRPRRSVRRSFAKRNCPTTAWTTAWVMSWNRPPSTIRSRRKWPAWCQIRLHTRISMRALATAATAHR